MSKYNRKFKGIWIPRDIWLSEKLTMQQKIFYAEVDSLDADGQGCYASNEYLAGFFQISVRRVQALIKSLVDLKLMEVKIDHYKQKDKRRIFCVEFTEPHAENGVYPHAVSGAYPHEQSGAYPHAGSGAPIIYNTNRDKKVKENKDQINADALIAVKKTAVKSTPKKRAPSDPINGKTRVAFENFYLVQFKESYYWTAKDSGLMSTLIKKIKFKVRENNQEPTEENILISLRYLMQGAIEFGSQFTVNTFSVAELVRAFDSLIRAIKEKKKLDGKNKAASKVPTSSAVYVDTKPGYGI